MTNSYKLTNIGLVLEDRLKNLKDGNDRKVFDKVLLGLGENDVKAFNRCIGIAYIKGANDFKSTFGTMNIPGQINSVVAFVVKGTSRARYDEAMKIADLIMYKFRTDNDWIYLIDNTGNTPKNTVKMTEITNFNVTLFPNNKRLDIACVFTLTHTTCTQ